MEFQITIHGVGSAGCGQAQSKGWTPCGDPACPDDLACQIGDVLRGSGVTVGAARLDKIPEPVPNLSKDLATEKTDA